MSADEQTPNPNNAAGGAAGEARPTPPPLPEEEIARLQSLRPPERFKDSGYAIVPHSILRIGSLVSGHAQHMLIEAIIHATFGAKGNPEWAAISLNELGNPKRSRYGRKAFSIALEDGVDRGLIQRRRVGQSWEMKVVPEVWSSARPYVRHIPNPTGTPTFRNAAGRFALDPDKTIHLDEALANVQDRSNARFTVANDSRYPVRGSLEVGADGLMTFVIENAPEGEREANIKDRPEGEPKANDNGGPVPCASNRSVPSEDLALLREALDPIFLKLFRKVADEKFLTQIAGACSSPGRETAEMLAARIAEKVKKNVYMTSGLILSLAEDVGTAWRAEAAERTKAEAAAASQCPACHGTGRHPMFVQDVCRECGGSGQRTPPVDL